MERILQFILSLSLLIVLHEMGHFIPARIFKTRVEKFFLFFDPWFALFKKKIGDTVYGIGWLPLGGYVKISGMVDESMDTEALKEPPKPWEFRAKPAWQRLIIITGGVIVNFILGIIIYAGIMAYYGEDYLAVDKMKYGIGVGEVGREIGLEDGDKVIAINGMRPERYSQIPIEMVLSDGGNMTIERNGETVTLPITAEMVGKMIDKKEPAIFLPMPFIVGEFSDSSVAKEAGMQVGDSLYAVNGEPLIFHHKFIEEIPKHKDEPIVVTAYRNGEPMEFTMTIPASGLMGIRPEGDLTRVYDLETKKYGGLSALGAGFRVAGEKLSYYVRQFKVIFSPETGAYKEVGGFITIAKQFENEWNWRKFWEFTAFLSLMLGFLNILPIPALDGGHMIFILFEMVSGRKPSTKFLEYAQMVGFFLLLALIVLANGNDVMGLFR